MREDSWHSRCRWHCRWHWQWLGALHLAWGWCLSNPSGSRVLRAGHSRGGIADAACDERTVCPAGDQLSFS